MQSNVLVVNQKEYRIGSQGGLVNIDVQVNRIPETSLSETWASVSNIVTYDKNNKRIIVGIDPNISFQKRTVILSLKNKNLTAEVVIAQNGSNAMMIFGMVILLLWLMLKGKERKTTLI